MAHDLVAASVFIRTPSQPPPQGQPSPTERKSHLFNEWIILLGVGRRSRLGAVTAQTQQPQYCALIFNFSSWDETLHN